MATIESVDMAPTRTGELIPEDARYQGDVVAPDENPDPDQELNKEELHPPVAPVKELSLPKLLEEIPMVPALVPVPIPELVAELKKDEVTVDALSPTAPPVDPAEPPDPGLPFGDPDPPPPPAPGPPAVTCTSL